jgi:predicted small lipoprotein YifL
MRNVLTALIIIATAAATSGCSAFRVGGTPDELAVTRNAPLVLPPDYHLTPPVAGTAGLTAGDAQQQAIDALFGGPAPRSAVETSMLDVAGRNSAQMGIRSTVRDAGTRVVDKGTATLTIINSPPANSAIASAQPGQ